MTHDLIRSQLPHCSCSAPRIHGMPEARCPGCIPYALAASTYRASRFSFTTHSHTYSTGEILARVATPQQHTSCQSEYFQQKDVCFLGDSKTRHLRTCVMTKPASLQLTRGEVSAGSTAHSDQNAISSSNHKQPEHVTVVVRRECVAAPPRKPL